MKKSLLFIITLSTCIISFSQVSLRRQAYWGALIFPNAGGEAGVTIQRMVAGSPADRAGLQNGDVVIKANGILLSDANVYGKTFRGFRSGDKVLLTVVRNEKFIEIPIVPTDRPLEQYKNIDVEYGSVISSKGHHLRTILTRPANIKSRLPVIFVTQWLSCSQVEANQARMSSTDSLFNELITKSGYAVMRVEKPGLGDSEGPDCSDADYVSELAGYRAAFKALKKNAFIDTASIYVLGISIGGASAPLLFQNENIKGYIITGGFYKTWYEHMLEIERRILVLRGRPQGEVNVTMRKQADFYNDYLNYKLTPKEVLAKKPYLQGIWTDGDAHQYGRPAVYYQQVQDMNVAAAWEKIKSPTLVLYGEYDWIMTKEDHELIAEAVNKNNKGKGTLVVVPRMSHNFTTHPSLQESFNNTNGVFSMEACNQILKWLKNN